MVRSGVIAVLAVLMAACSSSQRLAPEERPLGAPLLCEAAAAQVCPRGGCSTARPGYELPTPISLNIPAFAETGEICIGQNCEPARYAPIETVSSGWAAVVATGQGWLHPVGELEVGYDRTWFALVRPASDGDTTWRGMCRIQGS